MCESSSPAGAKVSEAGEAGSAPGVRAEAPGAAHGEDGWLPASHGDPWGRRDPPAAWGGPSARAGGYTKEPMGELCWTGLQAGPVD